MLVAEILGARNAFSFTSCSWSPGVPIRSEADMFPVSVRIVPGQEKKTTNNTAHVTEGPARTDFGWRGFVATLCSTGN